MCKIILIFILDFIVQPYCEEEDDDDEYDEDEALLTCVTRLSQDGKTLVKVRGSAPSSRK